MNRTIDRLKVIFLAIFAVANVGILVWEFGWELPEQPRPDFTRSRRKWAHNHG